MYPFTYTPITRDGSTITADPPGPGNPNAMFLAGGTNLIDEMKLNVRRPEKLVDITGLDALTRVEESGGGLRIGALVRNSDLAYDARVVERYPVLSQALLSGASAQLRNMATTGGNLLQKTRCTYYRDVSYEQCNKRKPGSGCAALNGYNRMHALLGTSEACIATHPSDMCVALAALDASIVYTVPTPESSGASANASLQSIKLSDFYVPYGDDPAKENVLPIGALITHVVLPDLPWAKRSLYLKSRDRASYEFALASAAVIVELDGTTIKNARVALGGVASKPWRSVEAERALIGKEASDATFAAAADAALVGAKPRKYNTFKVELAKRTIVQALASVSGVGPGSVP